MSSHSFGEVGSNHIPIIESAFEASLDRYTANSTEIAQHASYYERLTAFDTLLEEEVRRIKVVGYYSLHGVETDITDPFAPVRAEHFLMVASNDAYNLIHFANLYMDDHDIANRNATLKRSSASLLRVAQLSDKDKFELVDDWLYRPQMPTVPEGIKLDIINSRGMQRKQSRDGLDILAWTDTINTWIDERTARGCPAAKIVRQTATGGRVTLLHHFWQRMVDVAHPVSS